MTKVRIGHNSGLAFVEDDSLSLSERGFEFQFYFTEKIIRRLSGFSTVTLKDMKGNIVNLENFRQRGKDGGLDLVIQIEASTEAAAKSVATKVRRIIIETEA